MAAPLLPGKIAGGKTAPEMHLHEILHVGWCSNRVLEGRQDYRTGVMLCHAGHNKGSSPQPNHIPSCTLHPRLLSPTNVL